MTRQKVDDISLYTHGERREVRVLRQLGAGGQGEVWEATIDGRPAALKWYFSVWSSLAQWDALLELVHRGPPDERFLWPEALATATGAAPATDGEPFGYLMPLREPRFHGLSEVLTRAVKPGLTQLAIAAFQLADSYRRLHGAGLAYRDISSGNAFLDPRTGDVAICDNDNVSVDGKPSMVFGTPRFIAPEILLREAGPSRYSDLWSLAVLLFHLFFNHHPLEGRLERGIHCLDSAAMFRLFAEDPIFIFHPDDTRNRPVPGEQDAAIRLWEIYPASLRELFTQAFTEGVRDPTARVGEGEWQLALASLRDAIFPCPDCGRSNVYDTEGTLGRCYVCGSRLDPPPRMLLTAPGSRSLFLLTPDAKLYPHHFGRRYDYSEVVAAVAEHPRRPGLWGLENRTDARWTFVGADGDEQLVGPGETMRLVAGRTACFGSVRGEIVA
ncbi:serine/threonine protein kinase [Solirubrobacter soli]|uniref:serine/threonine protein kinase n=1 Tax=Solirubrobacter soli TaxID=363832 RepID=UPI0004263568|nr:serine/threonine-protein kinase [Solirubrobacter soli]